MSGKAFPLATAGGVAGARQKAGCHDAKQPQEGSAHGYQGESNRTRIGVKLAVWDRVPSSPLSFPPQQYALPSVSTPQV